jgi:elongation factor 1-alpha
MNIVNNLDSYNKLTNNNIFIMNRNISIVVAGSVDSGKSTFIGVLHNNQLDDGNGYLRNKVCRHEHEKKSGRTSDISVKVINNNNKIIELIDLCGHSKYLKTTLYGITGYFPDYSIITIAANRGVLPMTKEHLGILLYLKIPIIIIITKIDIAPKKIYEETINKINSILKKCIFKKVPVYFDKDFENKLMKYIPIINVNSKYVPIITVSNKNGDNIDIARKFILSLEPRVKWEKIVGCSIFYIEENFTPPGMGLILYGILNGKKLKVGDKVLIGPHNKEYISVNIWSIHDCNRNSIKFLEHGQRGCIGIRINKKYAFSRKDIRKGMVILNDDKLIKNTCYEFDADITVLNHSTTIKNNYSAVIHCGVIKQTAKIKLINKEKIRIGNNARVKFKFLYYPEFLFKNSLFFFREGKTRGVGIIKEVYSIY